MGSPSPFGDRAPPVTGQGRWYASNECDGRPWPEPATQSLLAIPRWMYPVIQAAIRQGGGGADTVVVSATTRLLRGLQRKRGACVAFSWGANAAGRRLGAGGAASRGCQQALTGER